jgi:hypothetical protein
MQLNVAPKSASQPENPPLRVRIARSRIVPRRAGSGSVAMISQPTSTPGNPTMMNTSCHP